jgi:Tfp pilus assembly protein PilF
MKTFLSFSIALIIVFNVVDVLPKSKAPVVIQKNSLQAALLNDPVAKLSVAEESAEKSLLINLLDLYVEQERDLPKAAAVIDQQTSTIANQKILQLYQTKILARSLDFETALRLLETRDQDELALLKAAVLISLDDRVKAQSYLYELVETSSNAEIKSSALTLLQIYHEHDMHKDADGSYLWLLFAKHFTKLGEVEISQYLVEKTLKISPEYRDAWLIKSMNQIRLKQYDLAEGSLLSAYQSDPGNVQIQYLLGHNYYLLQNYDLSEQYFLYSLQQESQYKEDTLMKLGEIASLNEDHALAAHYFEQVQDLNQKHSHSLSQLIWIYGEKLNNLDKALELAERRQSFYPEDHESRELMRWILSKKGDLEEAEKYLSK